MAEINKERKRGANWSAAEKECLRELINGHVHVIENRQNDLRMISKKKSGWEAIKIDMLASGFDRDVQRMKQQWLRMKIGAKKAVSEVRKATAATGNLVPIPTLDESDAQIQSMLTCDLEEDTILIDSDTILITPIPPVCSPLGLRTPYCAVSPAADDDISRCNVASRHTVSGRNDGLLQKLQNLPKKNATKSDLIQERQGQISEESAHSRELHELKMEQLRAEIAHKERMQKRREEQLEELHALQCQLLRLQIKQYELGPYFVKHNEQ